MADIEQTTNIQPEEPNIPEQLPEVKQSFLKRHRLAVILSACALLLIAVGATFYFYNRPDEQTKTTETSSTTVPSTNTTKTAQTESANHWKSKVSPTAVPLGDNKVSSSPKSGYIYSCTTNFRGSGAEHSGEWLNAADGTWNSTTKVAVRGAVKWPNASYSASTNGSNRVIATNDLPNKDTTGIFPISTDDPAHQYDRNPNAIGIQNLSYAIPVNPTAASTPQCTGLGAIGVLINGVLLYNGLDAAGRDAVAHETQDSCSGHPDGGKHYHYHNISSCVIDSATGESTLVGYAMDGYGIYVERDQSGNLPTNADLDECHGRTSSVMWNGAKKTIYHYDATIEYPFTVGCFHGQPIVSREQGPRNP